VSSRPSLPAELEGAVFTAAEARNHGISAKTLRGPRIEAVYAGVYRYEWTPVTPALQICAARKLLPADAALSHVSNLAWRGLTMRPTTVLHFSSRRDVRVRRENVVLHRYRGALDPEIIRGVPLLLPVRTFVDCATMLSVRELVEVGDWMVAKRLVDLTTLRRFVEDVHLDGVQRARQAVKLVRVGAESVRESRVRWMLVSEGLPEPDLNRDIRDAAGRFLARGDIVYLEYKVLVEYDGWHHERDAAQRQHDHLRRERLEANGWRVIVVTAADMDDRYAVVARVRAALIQRGWRP
jgi:very-short-patch-repair endonuclease